MTNNKIRKKDIDALVSNIRAEFVIIEKLYKTSLHKKEIDPDLKIKIKNYLENARSMLDYCAHDIADSLSIVSTDIYFPIVKSKNGLTSFDGSIGRSLPKLKSKNQQVYNYLESIQPYHQGFIWLADFATVANNAKHSQLTPQARNETQRIISKHSGGKTVSWNPDLAKFGSGAFVNDAPVDPLTQMPMPTPETTVIKETWVDFKFNNAISVLPLLKNIHDIIPKIIEDIYNIIQ